VSWCFETNGRIDADTGATMPHLCEPALREAGGRASTGIR